MFLTALLTIVLQGVSAHLIGTGAMPAAWSPGTGEWTQWGEWAQCTSTFGTQIQTRFRTCSMVTCEGAPTEARPCTGHYIQPGAPTYVQPTPSPYVPPPAPPSYVPPPPPPAYVQPTPPPYVPPPTPPPYVQPTPKMWPHPHPPSEWGQWSPWGPCSVSCGGGIATRTRLCNNACASCVCIGASQETTPCNTQPCCEYGPWSEWSPCSVTCGNGITYRTRQCSCPQGGCEGPDREEQTCTAGPCPPIQPITPPPAPPAPVVPGPVPVAPAPVAPAPVAPAPVAPAAAPAAICITCYIPLPSCNPCYNYGSYVDGRRKRQTKRLK